MSATPMPAVGTVRTSARPSVFAPCAHCLNTAAARCERCHKGPFCEDHLFRSKNGSDTVLICLACMDKASVKKAVADFEHDYINILQLPLQHRPDVRDMLPSIREYFWNRGCA